LERMEVILRSMINDLEKAIQNPKIASMIIDRDNELDKFYFLLCKQIFISLKDREVGEKIGVNSSLEALPLKTYGKCIEEMGDAVVSISRIVSTGKLSREDVAIMKSMFSDCVRVFRHNDIRAKKRIVMRYNKFAQKLRKTFKELSPPQKMVAMQIARFNSLCIDVIEAHVERLALTMDEN